MFQSGQIAYFTSFQFKNGNTPKSKYFIVLANLDNVTLLASLPTRTNSVPSFVTIAHGCINLDERCYNSYLFEPNRVVGKGGHKFEMPTFIYGDQVDEYQVEYLESTYIEGVDYKILDILTDAELKAIIVCLKNSNSVKNKIKRKL
jgi:hypothetical protein